MRHDVARALITMTAAAGLTLALISCASTGGGSKASDPTSRGHWIYSDRLRGIMSEIDRKARTAWPQEVGAPAVSASSAQISEALSNMAPLATELEAAARRIPEVAAHARLGEADRRAFAALVETLGEQAGALKARIGERDIEAARRLLTEINATCVSCHDRFRDISGPMLDSGPQRAEATPRGGPSA